MAIRDIIRIDETKCNGCGLCVNFCAEGAIQLIDGKARLVNEVYCDGLGACLGHCPQDAIRIEKRDAAEFDIKATHEHLQKIKIQTAGADAFVCPGALTQTPGKKQNEPVSNNAPARSQLEQWPVQLRLVSATAPYFMNSALLLTADCVPFSMGDFHSTLLKEHTIAVGCPKLDDCGYYVDKLAQIIEYNHLRSLTVIHMEVPCCTGLVRIAAAAINKSGIKMGYEDITITLTGQIKSREMVAAQ